MKNVLSIDFEDWYQTELLQIHPADWDSMENRVQIGTERVLNLLTEHRVQATFFILGYTARRNPQLVQRIVSCGHEVGCHGYWHQPVYQQTRQQFRADLVAARAAVEDAAGRAVTLYRAPSWSISRQTLWALEELVELGFDCDSSIQPFWTPLSGIAGAPATPFRPIVGDRALPLVEYPPTTLSCLRWRLPFAGGLYLRALPGWLSSWALQQVNSRHPGMVYLHPWELDPEQPRSGPLGRSQLHRLNLRSTGRKLQRLLGRFQFGPLGEVIAGQEYPVRSV